MSDTSFCAESPETWRSYPRDPRPGLLRSSRTGPRAGAAAARAGPPGRLPEREHRVARAHPGAAALPALGRPGPGPGRGAPRGGHRAARARVGAPAGRPAVRGGRAAGPRGPGARRGAGRHHRGPHRPGRGGLGARQRPRAREPDPPAGLGARGRGGTSGVGRRRRQSRYDPRPAPTVRARIACAHPTCRAEQEVSFPPSYALHGFTCQRCRQPFSAYLAESREVRSTAAPFGRRLSFRLEPLGGGASRVQFDDGSPDPFHAARGDLLAFLYTEGPVLRGVTNLSTGRTLWRRRTGPCWIATQAYGEGAPRAGGAPDVPRRGAAANEDGPGRRRVLRPVLTVDGPVARASPRSRAWARRRLDALVRRIA